MALELYPWYPEFYEGIKKLIREERSSLVHVKWKIGKYILDFNEGLRSNGVVNDQNENATMRQMLKPLAYLSLRDWLLILSR